MEEEKTSISYLQRRLRIGYNRAATIIEQLEQTGVLSEINAKGQRDIIK
ncbi:MAG: DNA translocase FtsK [Campylobacter sp.]